MTSYIGAKAEPIFIKENFGCITCDLESDYASGRHAAFRCIDDLLALADRREIKITAFVEGGLFLTHSGLLKECDAAGVDLQLHCYDHKKKGGDEPDDISVSCDLYENLLNRKPKGYRGNTYQISAPLMEKLASLDFSYDSSILPAKFGYGAALDSAWRKHAHEAIFWLPHYSIFEIPVSVIPQFGAPFVHSYLHFFDRLSCGFALDKVSLPKYLVYDFHMVDLVNSVNSLKSAAIPVSAKVLYWMLWFRDGDNSFALLEKLIGKLEREQFKSLYLSELVSQHV